MNKRIGRPLLGQPPTLKDLERIQGQAPRPDLIAASLADQHPLEELAQRISDMVNQGIQSELDPTNLAEPHARPMSRYSIRRRTLSEDFLPLLQQFAWQLSAAPPTQPEPLPRDLEPIPTAASITQIPQNTIKLWIRQKKIRCWGRPTHRRVSLAEVMPPATRRPCKWKRNARGEFINERAEDVPPWDETKPDARGSGCGNTEPSLPPIVRAATG